jgi:outer membrane protein
MLFRPLCLSFALLSGAVAANGQQTPPVQPKTQQTPLPPAIELPGPPSQPADVPNRPLTADEAARIALRNQPAITEASAGILGAQGRTQQVRSGLLPTVGVNATYTHVENISPRGSSSGNNNGGTFTGNRGFSSAGFQTSAFVSQLLFDFNHTRDLVAEAAAREQAAGANLTRVQADTVLLVKQAFYTYAQNQRLVTVNENNVRNQQDHLAAARARLNSGLGLPSDVVRAQTAVAQAIQDLTVARNNASIARVNLALQMGIDPRTPIETAEGGEPPVRIESVTELVETAGRQRPEVLQAQANLKAAQHGVSAAKTTNAPSLSADLGVSGRGNSLPPRNDSFTVGASIQWNPFDGGFASGRVREAQAGVQTAQAQLTSTQLTVTAEVSRAYLDLRTAEQRVATTDAEVSNAEEALRLVQGRYRAGLGTFIDVIDAQAALLTARTNRVNAQTSVDQARAALSRAIGAPVSR